MKMSEKLPPFNYNPKLLGYIRTKLIRNQLYEIAVKYRDKEIELWDDRSCINKQFHVKDLSKEEVKELFNDLNQKQNYILSGLYQNFSVFLNELKDELRPYYREISLNDL